MKLAQASVEMSMKISAAVNSEANIDHKERFMPNQHNVLNFYTLAKMNFTQMICVIAVALPPTVTLCLGGLLTNLISLPGYQSVSNWSTWCNRKGGVNKSSLILSEESLSCSYQEC